MIGLDEIKEIVERCCRELSQDQFGEIESAVVLKDGWLHLGDDHFYNETHNLAAGPVDANGRRVLVILAAHGETGLGYDIALEWDRQADAGIVAMLGTGVPRNFEGERLPMGKICACGC